MGLGTVNSETLRQENARCICYIVCVFLGLLADLLGQGAVSILNAVLGADRESGRKVI